MRTSFKNQSDKDTYEKILKDRLNALVQRRLHHASKKISAITVQIFPSSESETSYRISVKNSGESTYKNIRIRYERILLWAEHFGVDTTRIPWEHQFARGEALLIDVLPPSTVLEFHRKGYNAHQWYDGPRNTEVKVTGPNEEIEGFPVNYFNWCEAVIDLPNAKGTRPV